MALAAHPQLTREVSWAVESAHASSISALAHAEGYLFIGEQSGALAALDLAEGRIKFRKEPSNKGAVCIITAVADRLLVGYTFGAITIYDMFLGLHKKVAEKGAPIAALQLCNNDVVSVEHTDGQVTAKLGGQTLFQTPLALQKAAIGEGIALGGDTSLSLWKEGVCQWSGPSESVCDLVFASGALFAAFEGKVVRYDIPTGEKVASFDQEVAFCSLAPDETTVLAMGFCNRMICWKLLDSQLCMIKEGDLSSSRSSSGASEGELEPVQSFWPYLVRVEDGFCVVDTAQQVTHFMWKLDNDLSVV